VSRFAQGWHRARTAAGAWPHTSFAVAGVLLVVALLLCLKPLLDGAYSADDTWNSQIPARLAEDGLTPWDYIKRETSSWMTSSGRFFPGSIAATVAVFSVLDSREAYKAFQMVIVLAAVLVFAASVGYLTRNRWNGLLAGAVMTALLQFRYTYDSIQHFNGQQSIIVIGLFVTLALITAYVRRRRWWVGLAATLTWSATLVTYESTYLLAPCLLVAALLPAATWRRRIEALSWVAAPMVLLGLLLVRLRTGLLQPPPPGYTVSLEPGAVTTTLAEQLSATLPLAEHYLGRQDRLSGLELPVSLSACLALLAVAACCLIALSRVTLTRRYALGVAAIALQLLVVPAGLVAITFRWQQEVRAGVGYVAVYLQSFGLALLGLFILAGLLALVRRLASRTSRPALVPAAAGACAVVLGLLASTVAANNQRVVSTTDLSLGWVAQQPYSGWARDLVDAALDRGVADHLPRGSRLAAVPGAPWLNSAYVSYEAGKQLDVVNPWAYFASSPGEETRLAGCPVQVGPCASSHAYDHVLYATSNGYGSGYSVVGEVAAARTVSPVSNDVAMTVRNAVVYIESPQLLESDELRLCSGLGTSAGPVPGPDVFRSGDGWVLLRVASVDAKEVGFTTAQGCAFPRFPLPWDS
jgi:hypothetical protein